MSTENKIRAWELFIRVMALSVAIGGPALGYQLNRLDNNDEASMQDRNLMRERIAVSEERSRNSEATVAEIKQYLQRIEDKVDRIRP